MSPRDAAAESKKDMRTLCAGHCEAGVGGLPVAGVLPRAARRPGPSQKIGNDLRRGGLREERDRAEESEEGVAAAAAPSVPPATHEPTDCGMPG